MLLTEFRSARLEQLDALGVPVDPPRDEGPDVGHEEILRLLLLDVLELQVGEFLEDGGNFVKRSKSDQSIKKSSKLDVPKQDFSLRF